MGPNTQLQTTIIRGSGILVQSIFRENKLKKKKRSHHSDPSTGSDLDSNPVQNAEKILAKFLKVWEQFGQVDNLETTANTKHSFSQLQQASLEKVQTCRLHDVYSSLSTFFLFLGKAVKWLFRHQTTL